MKVRVPSGLAHIAALSLIVLIADMIASALLIVCGRTYLHIPEEAHIEPLN